MDLHISKRKFLDVAKSAIPNFDEDLVSRAWDFAKDAHIDQKRVSGDTYFSHPVGVAFTLLDVDCDSATAAAALLHDCVEDTSVSIEEIKQQFGPVVASLVDGLTKLAPMDLAPDKVWTGEKSRRDNLRKLFVSIADDPRVAMIKLADRLHNLTTLGALPEDRQIRSARESLDVFAPLAEALGLGVFQSRIQEMAFRYLEPETYRELEQKVKERQTDFETLQTLAVESLQDALDEASIDALVYGRQKEIYSIHRKMVDMELDFEDVYDIIGIRIIVESEEDCYRAKYVVDQLGIEVKYDDYIGRPRGPLGYQSLHKVLLDKPGGTLIEVQIRSREMHERAERGTAAHWIYKLRGTSLPDPSLVKRIINLRDTLEALGNALAESDDDRPVSLEELVETIREDGLAPRIRAFTPKGDVISLPAGATPLDFAYYIHTELGHECIGASVNGKQVSLDYELRDGDTVAIIKRKGATPKLYWLTEGKVKSTRARQKVRQYFRDQKRPQAVAYGRQLVRKRLKSLKDLDVDVQDLVGTFAQTNLLGVETDDDLYLAVAEGRVSSDRLNRTIGKLAVDSCLTNKSLSKEHLRDLVKWAGDTGLISMSREESLFLAIAEGEISIELLNQALQDIVEGVSEQSEISAQPIPSRDRQTSGYLLTRVAQCCCPLPGDSIIGYVTTGHGLSIHRTTCPSVLTTNRKERVRDDITWRDVDPSGEERYSAELFLMLDSVDSGTYKKIHEAVLRAEGIIRVLTPMGTSKRFLSQVRLIVDVKDTSHLARIQQRLKQIDSVVEVRRTIDD